jgi:hypothetical protein
MERIRIMLEDTEYAALVRLSECELRPLPDQVRAIVRERLRQTGLLNHEDCRQQLCHDSCDGCYPADRVGEAGDAA